MRKRADSYGKREFQSRSRHKLTTSVLIFFLVSPSIISGKSEAERKFSDQEAIYPCPSSCTCTELKPKSQGSNFEQDVGLDDELVTSFNNKSKDKPEILKNGIKLMCQNPALIVSVKSLNFSPSLLENTVHVDLSGNSLSKLTSEDFNSESFVSLQKLFLKNNQIVQIDLDAFAALKNLKHLDISNNKLASFSSGIIEPLENLERIKLGGNPLVCDCNLSLLLIRVTARNIKLQGACTEPARLKDRPLSRLSPEELTCPPEDPFVIEIRPNTNQIVFEGDPLKLSCKFKVGRVSSPIWTHTNNNNRTATVSAGGVAEVITGSRGTEQGTVTESQLVIRHLLQQHGGTWTCAWGGRSASVEVTVLSLTTPTCPSQVTTSNKGRYNWPRTMASLKVVLSCQANPTLQAFRLCGSSGNWEEPDLNSCFYLSEVTKVLEQFAKTNLTFSKTSALESVRRLKSYLTDVTNLTDPHEAIFVTQTLHNYLEASGKHSELLPLIMDVYTILTRQNSSILADSRHGLLGLLQQSALKTPVFEYQSSGLAIEKYTLTGKTSLAGSCVWRYLPEMGSAKKPRSRYRVGCGQNSSGPGEVEATIRIPLINDGFFSEQSVVLSLILNTNVFASQRSKQLATHVVGVTTGHITNLINRTTPFQITLRIARTIGPSDRLLGARWNQYGDQWSAEQCQTIRPPEADNSTVTFQCCCGFGFFGAFIASDEDTRETAEHVTQKAGDASASFIPYRPQPLHLLPAPIYVGSVIGMLCHLTAFLCYIIHRPRLRMTPSTWHALINSWLSLAFLMVTFTLGVRPLLGKLPCQVTGLLLHYLTLSSLLWTVVNASNLYKHLTKNSRADCDPDSSQMEEAQAGHDSHAKPALRFYLVGWGVPLIVVGIAGAIHLEQYHSPSFCFLAWTPSLGAVGLPSAILILLILTFHLLSWCYMRHTARMIALHQQQLAAQQEARQVPNDAILQPSKEPNFAEQNSMDRKGASLQGGYLPLTADGDVTSCPSNMTTQVTETSDLASLSSDHERIALLVQMRRGEAEGAMSANESGVINSGRSESERPLLMVTSSSVASSSEDRIEEAARTDVEERGHSNPLMTSFTEDAESKKRSACASTIVLSVAEPTQPLVSHQAVPTFNPPTPDESDERNALSQLRGQFLFLILFCLTWLSGLSVVARPFRSILPHYDEMLSSLSYAFFSAATGLFSVIFHLLMRKDVCVSCFDGPPKEQPEQVFATLSAGAATTETAPSNSQHHHQANLPIVPYATLLRRPEAATSVMVDEIDCAPPRTEVPVLGPTNFDDLNVIVLDPALVVNSFYDARQSKIAKRFFQKQKLLQMQNNQLHRHQHSHHHHHNYHHRHSKHSSRHSINNAPATYRSHSSHSPIAEEALLGAGASGKAKVSNVNIHVEMGAYDLHELQSRMSDHSWTKSGKQLLTSSGLGHRSDSYSLATSRSEVHATTIASMDSVAVEGNSANAGAVARSTRSDRAKRKRHGINHQRTPKKSKWEGYYASRAEGEEGKSRAQSLERSTYAQVENQWGETVSTSKLNNEDEALKTLNSSKLNVLDSSFDDESLLKRETSV